MTPSPTPPGPRGSTYGVPPDVLEDRLAQHTPGAERSVRPRLQFLTRRTACLQSTHCMNLARLQASRMTMRAPRARLYATLGSGETCRIDKAGVLKGCGGVQAMKVVPCHVLQRAEPYSTNLQGTSITVAREDLSENINFVTVY